MYEPGAPVPQAKPIDAEEDALGELPDVEPYLNSISLLPS